MFDGIVYEKVIVPTYEWVWENMGGSDKPTEPAPIKPPYAVDDEYEGPGHIHRNF